MEVKKGSKVKVEYEGRFENGEVFDTSKQDGHDHPLEFEVGSGMVIQGFDKAVTNMKVDDEKEITIESKDGYGDYDGNLKKDISREMLPKEQEPKVGMMLALNTPNGHQVPVKIVTVNDKTVTLDMNHPLAGKKLIFKIKLLDVNNS